MYPSVRSRFRAFTQRFEGDVPYMYADIKGLVTVGVGNLIDPVSVAQALPFQFKSKPAGQRIVPGVAGARATADQITAEWQRVKHAVEPGHSQDGAPQSNVFGHQHYESLTDLELNPEAIGALVGGRLAKNERILLSWPEFQDLALWPADAQLGLLSMAWAIGPGQRAGGGFMLFPRFRQACAAQRFDLAAHHCHIRDIDNAGVTPRNEANKTLFVNAAGVIAGEQGGYNRATLYYPIALATTSASEAGS